jgi:hypothetical protein
MDKNKAISGYEKIFDDGYKAGRASVALPHPCDGELYKDWTSADYFAKIAEEHLEVIDAYKAIEKSSKQPTKEERDHFFKECTDLIVATTGLMNYLGCDEEMRQKHMKEINESNAKRDGGKRFKKHPLDVIEERFYKGKTFSASKTQLEEKTKHDEENLEIGEIVKLDCIFGEKEAIFLGKSKRDSEKYDVSINGLYYTVPRGWIKKVENR